MPKITDSKYVVFCGWDNVPHLTDKAKEELTNAYPLHERDARTKGLPGLGSGAIYPLGVENITCESFVIPDHFPRVFSMDVGWKTTCALWGAWDRDADTLYIYTEHYAHQQLPSTHTSAIKARGEWIPGVIDPASGSSGQIDGKQLLANYRALGLDLTPADNSVEAGILQVWQRLASGRLKIFKNACPNLLDEYRFYRRDKDGKIVKDADHAMDTLRYLVVSGLPLAICQPVAITAFPSHRRALRSGY